MKRTILVAAYLLLSINLFAQVDSLPWNSEGKIVFDKTIKVNGNKDKLYEGALQWVAAQGFNKPEKGVAFNDVITYQNKNEGKIFGNGKFKFDTKYPQLGYYDYMYMTFIFKIYVKNGEYHYVFSDFKVNRLTWHKRDHIGQTSFEDFAESGYYKRHSEVSIEEHLSKLKHDLKLAILGEL